LSPRGRTRSLTRTVRCPSSSSRSCHGATSRNHINDQRSSSGFLWAHLSQRNISWLASWFSLAQSGFIDWTATRRSELDFGRHPGLFPTRSLWVDGSLEEFAWKHTRNCNVLALCADKSLGNRINNNDRCNDMLASAGVIDRLIQSGSSTGKLLELGLYGKIEICFSYNEFSVRKSTRMLLYINKPGS
jgi:hypothetical protein